MTYLIQVKDLKQSFVGEVGLTVLESSLLAGVAMASSCRNGTCRTCICKLDSGSIDYQIDWPGLSQEEKDQGWFLPCVAVPMSDLVLSFP
ncbi:MAG: 2Fe-2S iron-sulfur cluster binding domain-containing protein [Burkholderiaceae bacterium]|nr:2Fe-2S iron-sulfur cluster binding domain-containing protein [Burkholderiaceae bacterium]